MEGDFLPCDRKAYPAFDQADASRAVRQGDVQPAVRIERRARSIGKTEGADFAALRHQRFGGARDRRSEEHTSELQSLMRNSYAVFCLKKKKHEIRHSLKRDTYSIQITIHQSY